jgi:hypothetical protein
MMATQSKKYDYISQVDYEAVAGPDWPSYEVFCQHKDVKNSVYDEIDSMLHRPRPFDHPSFCIVPFYSKELIGQHVQVCSLMPDKSNVSLVKKAMLDGSRPSACDACWNLENVGTYQSDRQIKNAWFDYFMNKNLSDVLEECNQGKNTTVLYKIDTSNTCNATCVTCGPDNSSSWTQLLRKNKQSPVKNWQIKPSVAHQRIDYHTTKGIIFRGGEPLLSETNFHILEQLVLANNTDCHISFCTNGSVTPSEVQATTLKKFSNLNFSFSIDGIGPVFEYLRYPLKWNKLEENIQWCRDRNIDVSVNCIVTNLSVFYLDQTIAWFDANHIPYRISHVIKPEWFSPKVLPYDIKKKINFAFEECNRVPDLLVQFREKIAEQDSWKGINMRHYLPELADLLG